MHIAKFSLHSLDHVVEFTQSPDDSRWLHPRSGIQSEQHSRCHTHAAKSKIPHSRPAAITPTTRAAAFTPQHSCRAALRQMNSCCCTHAATFTVQHSHRACEFSSVRKIFPLYRFLSSALGKSELSKLRYVTRKNVTRKKVTRKKVKVTLSTQKEY